MTHVRVAVSLLSIHDKVDIIIKFCLFILNIMGDSKEVERNLKKQLRNFSKNQKLDDLLETGKNCLTPCHLRC